MEEQHRASDADGRNIEPTTGEGRQTSRARERIRENESFVPVIVKRTDEVRRHPDDILLSAIAEGLQQLCRPALSLGLSAVGAGLILGFTAMAVAVMTVVTDSTMATLHGRLATALVYPLGFVVCIMSGSQLFTEHTATAVYPVLDRRAPFGRLLRLWVVVAAGNLVGAMASSGLLALSEPVIGAKAGYLEIARHLVAFDSLPLTISAVLAGWLMALAAWLILATPPAVSQLVAIYLVTFLIGFGGLHHSIAGAVEMFTAVWLFDEFSWAQVLRFLACALFGNLLGGSLFVAVLNYAHIRRSQAQ